MFSLTILVLAQAAWPSTTDGWRGVFEGKPAIAAVGTVSPFPGVDLARPLDSCPKLRPLPARGVAAFNLSIDAGGGRRTDVDVWISELPEGTNALKQVKSAGAAQFPDDFSCLLSKRGVSLVQVGRYRIGLPTLCRKGYYQSAVTAVLGALHGARPDDFPAEFIYAPCGTMLVKTSKTAPFVKRSERLPSKRSP